MAFAFVRSATSWVNGSPGVNVFSVAPASGNIITLLMRWEGTTTGNAAATQSGGSAFTMGTRVDTSSNDHHAQFAYLIGCSTTNLFVLTFPTGFAFEEVVAMEFSSGDAATFDTQNTGSGSSGTSLVSGSINTDSGSASWLVLGGGSSYSSGQTYSSRNINGAAADGSLTGLPNGYCSQWYDIPAGSFSGGTATATVTSSDAWVCNILALKAGSGGGGRTTKNTRSWNLGRNVGMGHRIPV